MNWNLASTLSALDQSNAGLIGSYLRESFLSWRGFFLLEKSMEPISLICGPV